MDGTYYLNDHCTNHVGLYRFSDSRHLCHHTLALDQNKEKIVNGITPVSFVYVETEQGGQRKCLKVGEKPKLSFCFTDDKPVSVYAYCNLHGLWKTEII